ncbi:MAG: FtsQ-type POTRA domain-containing protein [Deferribacteres bacterium]|nr:FtsQ-type POTRA domain-containing protein [Deferribacteres bacterium]
MRSGNKKRRAAYRRGERLAIFLRRGIIFFLIVILVSAAVMGVKFLAQQFRVREIVVYGNYQLGREDIVGRINVKKGDSLLSVNLEDIDRRLRQSAWIREVSLKKRFPDTLMIKIEEAVPKALLRIKKRLYLIDGEGRILERIRGESTLFLPVIKDINPKNKKAVSEALKLADAISRSNLSTGSDPVEIGLESYGLTVNIDGEFMKVGYGRYREKLARWIEIEPEVRKRGLPLKYIDLRFKDSVIVKPVKKLRRKAS